MGKRARWGVAAAAVAATLPLHAVAGAGTGSDRVVDGHIDDWLGASSLVGGTVQYSEGEFVYQDYVYDDTGATGIAQRPPQHGTFEGRSAGSFRYPDDPERYADNAADLLELRLAVTASDVFGLVRLNAYRDPSTTVAAISFDVDGDAADSAGVWPREAGLASPGADRIATVWGTGGEIVDLDTGAVTPIDVAASTDDTDNAIEFRVPRAALPGVSWRVQAATGLWDGDSWAVIPGGARTSTSPGHGGESLPRAFNVAFRPNESGAYYDAGQAAALTRRDISAFVATVDVGAMESAATVPFVYERGRFMEVIVEQSFTIGPLHEGTSYEGVPGRFGGAGGAALNQHFDFFGRHQPYTLRLPSDWDPSERWPMVLALHGLGGSHGGWVTGPSFNEQVLEAPGHDSLVLVAPLGRGSSFYADYGEKDVLEVLADAESRLAIDTSRRYLAGYSMGGYGTYRLATTRPDMWAAAATFAGYTGEFTGNYQPSYQDTVGGPTGIGNPVRDLTGVSFGNGSAGQAATGNPVALLGNVREIPILHLAGSNDEIVPVTGQYRAAQQLDALDYRHRFDLYPGYEHLSFALFDNWGGVRDWFGTHTSAAAPRRVTYRFSPAYADPNLGVDLGLRYDSAYWVSGLVRREGPTSAALDVLTYGRIDAESHALAGQAHTVEPVRGLGLDRFPHVQVGDTWTFGDALPVDNRLTVDLANVSATVIEAAAAGLTPAGLTVTVTTDGPAVLTIAGDFSAVTATGPASTSPSGLVVALPDAGTYTVATA